MSIFKKPRTYIDSRVQALNMKKILAISTLTIAALMLTPMSIGPVTSLLNFNYAPNLSYVQLGPLTTLPQGLPLCKNASLGSIVCYSPSFIKKAYEYPSTATIDGAGQTIVIVDAFGSPTVESDPALFDSLFGIPAPPSFTIFCGNSPKPFDTSTCPHVNINTNPMHGVFSWTIETSLDVQYAHAMAPGANIVLDVAATSSGNAINEAEAAAIAAFPGAIFSQSFGIPEIFLTANNGQIMQAQTNYANGVAMGDTFFASATGGAPSIIFGVPSYQTGLGLSARGPDVDYNAAIDGGVLVVYGGLGSPVLFIVGGTSAGSPQWAGIIALANQARASLGKGPIGDLNPVLYGIYHSARYATDFHDITVGNDQLVGSSVGFSAGTGYDVASGIGSPIVDQLIVDLAAA